jgi:intracellular septation protein A
MLYKKLDSSYGIGLTGLKKTTKYYEKELLIERCSSCAIEHNSSNRPALLIFLTTMIVSGIITWFFAKRVYICIIVGIVAGIVGMVMYISLIYRKRIKALVIIDSNDTDHYLPVKQLLDEGWQTYKPG